MWAVADGGVQPPDCNPVPPEGLRAAPEDEEEDEAEAGERAKNSGTPGLSGPPFRPLPSPRSPPSSPFQAWRSRSLGARPSASSIAQWDKVLPPPLSPPQQHHQQQLAQQLVYQQRRQVRGVRRHHSSSDAMAGQKRPTQLSVPGGHQSLPPGVPVPWIMLGGIRKSRR